jgi:hypothetical protein
MGMSEEERAAVVKAELAKHNQEVGIILDEKVVGLWNFHLRIPEGDYLAAIRELVPEEKYELTYRLRYYKDDKVFESKDEKHWWQGTLSGTRNYVVLGFRSAVEILAQVQRSEVYEVLNETGDLREFMKRVERLPSMFLRQESK